MSEELREGSDSDEVSVILAVVDPAFPGRRKATLFVVRYLHR